MMEEFKPLDPKELAREALHDENLSPEDKMVAGLAIDAAQLSDTPIPPSTLNQEMIHAVESQFAGIKLGAPQVMLRGELASVGVYTLNGMHIEDVYGSQLQPPALEFTAENLTAQIKKRNFRLIENKLT